MTSPPSQRDASRTRTQVSWLPGQADSLALTASPETLLWVQLPFGFSHAGHFSPDWLCAAPDLSARLVKSMPATVLLELGPRDKHTHFCSEKSPKPPPYWNQANPVRIPGTETFWCPPFFMCKEQAPGPSLSSTGQIQQVLIRKGRRSKTRENRSRKNSTALGQGLFLPQGIHISVQN